MTTTNTTPATETTTTEVIAMVYHPTIGIIGHLRAALWSPEGTTKGEMVAKLSTLFPDRDTYGMATTVQIQLGRLQRKWGKITSEVVEGRGRVYKFAERPVNPETGEGIEWVG